MRSFRSRWFYLPLAALVGSLSIYLASISSAAARPPTAALTVSGAQLFDANRRPVRMLGVNFDGTEDTCVYKEDYANGSYGVDGGTYFRWGAPGDHQQIIDAMKTWHVNTVRVVLNESCWLGRDVQYAGAPYRQAMIDWVRLLRSNNMYVVLAEVEATAGRDMSGRPQPAIELLPMLDRALGIPFWRSVARTFRTDRGIVFDLYNEPHGVTWSCWLHGCRVSAGHVCGSNGEPASADCPDGNGNPGPTLYYPSYRAVGMGELVRDVRAQGARQPIMLGGLDWAADPSGWRAWHPRGDRQLIASVHTYGSLDNGSGCNSGCRAKLADIRRYSRLPVIAGEFGEADCKHGFVDDFMAWADRNNVSYLAWAFNQTDSQCGAQGPALITKWDGTPTTWGAAVRDHLREID